MGDAYPLTRRLEVSGEARLVLERAFDEAGVPEARGEESPAIQVVEESQLDRPYDRVVLIVVGEASDSSVVEAAARGARDYWTLPLRASIVALRVAALVREHGIAQRQAAQEEQFESLISNIPGMVYRCEFDAGWTMQYISSSVEEMTGYPPDEFISERRDYAIPS